MPPGVTKLTWDVVEVRKSSVASKGGVGMSLWAAFSGTLSCSLNDGDGEITI